MTYLHMMTTPSVEVRNGVGRNDLPASADDELNDESAAQLTQLMQEIARQLHAEDVLFAWHEADEAPALLFVDGGDQPRSAAERAMTLTAAQAARACRVAGSAWRELEDGELLTASLPAHGGVITVTTLFASAGGATRADMRDGAARLMPLIQPFLWMWSLRRRLMSRLRGLTAAVNNADFGVVLVDCHAHVLFANTVAGSILAQNDGLRLNGDLLSGAKLADTLRLRAAIEHVCAVDGMARLRGAAPVVPLYRRDRRPLLTAVVPADGGADGGKAAAVLYLFDPEQNLGQLIEPACKLYGLSPVETRLTCLLTDGQSLSEAATRMRVREQTARSYLKQIFGKTQTNRQAELVWLMLKSSVRTAPGCRTSFV